MPIWGAKLRVFIETRINTSLFYFVFEQQIALLPKILTFFIL